MRKCEERYKNSGESKSFLGNRRIRDRLFVFLALFVFGAGVLMASGLDVHAANKPTGGLAKMPLPETAGVDEVESGVTVIDEELIPEPLDTVLDAGEHYKYLSTNGKVLYDAVYKAIASEKYVPYSSRNITIPNTGYTSNDYFKTYAYIYDIGTNAYSFTSDEFNQVLEALAYDHPDQVEYYLCNVSNSGYYVQDGKNYNWIFVKAMYDDTKFSTMDSQITSSLDAMISTYKAEDYVSSEFDAFTEYNIYFFNDEVKCYPGSVTYDNDAVNTYYDPAHTAWGALYEKSAVCDGYSCGFQLIMEKLGIDCRVVTGKAEGSPGSWGGHAWNMVKLDGKWYDVDTTWYSSTTEDLNWFNKTTEQFKADHDRTPSAFLGSLLETATGTHWTYDYIIQESGQESESTIAVTGITVSPGTKTIAVDESFVPEVAFTPSDASNTKYTIASSNPEVACVSGTAVTGISAGTATITVTSEDGNHTGTCVVTVVVPVTGITVTPETKTINYGESLDLVIGFTPENATDKTYTITSSDTTVASVSGNKVTGEGEGTATITVTSNDGNYTDTCVVTVNVPVAMEVEDEAGSVYEVTSDNSVSYEGASATANTAEIPDSVTIGNKVYKVTEISDKAFKGNKNITKISGGANITSIGKSAFQGCTNLKNVNITSNKLNTIGNKAFCNCKKLKKITLNGNKLKTVKANSFKNVKSNVKIVIKAKASKYNTLVNKIKKAGASSATFKKK